MLRSSANDDMLGFEELLSLNFKRCELKYGKLSTKIEGLSVEEYSKIWKDLSSFIEEVLSSGAYTQ